VSMRISILDLLKSLGADRGLAYLFISHDFGVVRYFAAGGRIMVMFFGVVVETGPVEEVIANPKHPYTFLLLDAIPEPNPRLARRERSEATRIAAERIEAYPAETGCIFANRCPFVRDRCRAEKPPLRNDDGGEHLSACWYPELVPSVATATAAITGESVTADKGVA
jgi:oligopeptide/dipeptide ABC transporter ATP-binding protein